MKRPLLVALVILLFSSCITEVVEVFDIPTPETLSVSFEGDSRIELDENVQTVWNKGDLLSVYYYSNANQQWKFQGETGDRTGTLKKIRQPKATRELADVVAVYPYNREYYINSQTCNIEVFMPATQTYKANSYGSDGNIMVSVGDDENIFLRSVVGWVELQLTGKLNVLKRIVLRGNDNEQVAGLVLIDPHTAKTTLSSGESTLGDDNTVGGTLIIGNQIIREVSLLCSKGVILDSKPTSFYIALPPQEFSKGMTIDLYYSDGSKITKSTEQPITIERNTIQPFCSIIDEAATGVVFAENSIKVVSETTGKYTLMYEGKDYTPLTDYAAICTLTVDELAYYEDFIGANTAPSQAKAIGIYDSNNKRQGTISLSLLRPNKPQEPLYTFGLLSDLHIGRLNSYAEADFKRALKFLNEKNVSLTCICGDITENGIEAELIGYNEIASLSEIPVYTTSGNHDGASNGVDIDLWKKYTGEELVFEKTMRRGGKVDHFLFLGMRIWSYDSGYFNKHITWLEQKLEEYEGERCFIITHLFFPDRAGNLNGIYPSQNWLRGEQLDKLQALCDKYTNTIWFSGHSHWEWQLQKYQDRANIYRRYEGIEPASGWCVHVSSCGLPSTSDGSSRVGNLSGSEGAIVEVYENYVNILGIDFISGKYLPIATYKLTTP